MTEEERKWKKEVKRQWREKPWVTRLPVWKKEGGGGIFYPASQIVKTSAIFNIICNGGGVLSCLLNPLQCLRAAIAIVFTIVCGWEKKEKRGGSRGRKENLSLCVGRTQQESYFMITWVCQQSKALSPWPATSCYSVCLCCLTPESHECASQAGKQRHQGFSWWWEPTSDWFPWILMWRIVCFIEEQKEARWLPFRIG